MTIKANDVTMITCVNDDSFDRMPVYMTMLPGNVTVLTVHVTIELDETFFKLRH